MILLVLFTTLLSQKPVAKAKPKPPAPVVVTDPGPTAATIRTIRVTGNKNFSSEGIIKYSGLKVGQTADQAAFEAARVKLANSGVFEQVGYKFAPAAGGGIDGLFEIVEIPQVFTYRFEELPASREEIVAYLKAEDPLFSERIPATKEFLTRYARAIETFLKPKGLAEGISAKLVSDTGESLVVSFRPDRPMATIAQVGFKGNEAVPTPVLQIAMNQIAMGSPYKQDIVRQFLETTIRPIYEQRGRLEVAFGKVTAAPSADNKGINVMVELVEGPSFDVGDIRMRGAIGDPKPLYQTMVLQPGDLANITEINAAMKRVQSHLVRDGYLKATVKYDRKLRREKEKPLADLLITVAPGPLYTFGKLKIDGLDIVTEPQIRKMWGMEPDKPYNGEYPELFLNRLREENIFENLGSTKPIVTPNEQTHVVDVTLVFGKAVPAPAQKKRRF